MTHLIACNNTYRVHTVDEVEQLHEVLKNDSKFELMSFSYTTKYIKQKGEIIDEYQIVKAKLVFADEKYPETRFEVEYHEI
jgi:hypothetical protein